MTMDKEKSSGEDDFGSADESLRSLLGLEPDSYDEYKDIHEDVKEDVFKCEEKMFDIKEVNTPQDNSDNPSTSKILEYYKTPHCDRKNKKNVIQKDSELLETDVVIVRETPLPLMKWADCSEVWQNMIYKEEATLKLRNSKLLREKNTYLPRMRAILLDWIMEVSEVYHLSRTTYYLAVDYIDRFLTTRPTIPKTHLQLLGVTCLFIAAKLDEIYSPKLTEFSYVCDGACTKEEILACEGLILNTLDWDLSPMTPTNWLNLYMQIHYNAQNLVKNNLHEGVTNFQYPQYSSYEFTKASHVMDLFSMDPGFLEFSYSVVAAGAMFYTFGKEVALKVSGLTWSQLEPCVDYMYIFNQVITEANDPRLLSMPHQPEDERLTASLNALRENNPCLVSDEAHRLQTHVIDLEYFEKTVALRSEILKTKEDDSTEEGDTTLNDNKDDDSRAKDSNSDCSAADVINEIEKILEEHYLNNKNICNEKSAE